MDGWMDGYKTDVLIWKVTNKNQNYNKDILIGTDSPPFHYLWKGSYGLNVCDFPSIISKEISECSY